MPRRPLREPIPAAVRRAVLARDNYRCQSCGSTAQLNVDHIKPVARGGNNSLKNLQTLCWPCNRAKNVSTYNYANRRKNWRRSDPISKSQKKTHKRSGDMYARAQKRQAKQSGGCCCGPLALGLMAVFGSLAAAMFMVRPQG